MRSKNEVIIADLLDRLAQGRWAYEQPLTLDRQTRYPDFAIHTDDPDHPLYWEHLGMFNNPHYAARWDAKRQGYAQHGILPGPGGGPSGILLVTDDRDGVYEPAWEAEFKAL
ncbi:hypothetical protein [Streptomyces sp. NPDC008317]|uniref:hypothetical protein n=2 Tax=Streptomyces TaxID=1883 RepID=UPI0036E85CCA